jgi:hypothetical protein
MTFWDRFVLWLYAGLAGTVPVGRDTAARLFGLAFQQGRLMPAFLNDLSLLLLLASGPAGSPLHTAADAEATGRGLLQQPQRLRQLLQALQPERLTDLLELGRSGQPLWRAALVQTLPHCEVVSHLCDFLGRLFLVESDSRRSQADRLVLEALTRYYRSPPGTVAFSCRLYQHVLQELRPQQVVLPSVLPASPRPAWFSALDADEQILIQRCLSWLSEPDMTLLYLNVYARLDAKEVASVLNRQQRGWTADRVAGRLELCWQTVLS